MNALTGLEIICEAMGAFWTHQSDEFEVVGGAMQTNLANLPPVIVEKRYKDSAIADWNNTKVAFSSYSTIMTRIANLYNFQTDAKKDPEQSIEAAELAFTLRIPASIDVSSIMNPA